MVNLHTKKTLQTFSKFSAKKVIIFKTKKPEWQSLSNKGFEDRQREVKTVETSEQLKTHKLEKRSWNLSVEPKKNGFVKFWDQGRPVGTLLKHIGTLFLKTLSSWIFTICMAQKYCCSSKLTSTIWLQNDYLKFFYFLIGSLKHLTTEQSHPLFIFTVL